MKLIELHDVESNKHLVNPLAISEVFSAPGVSKTIVLTNNGITLMADVPLDVFANVIQEALK